MTAFLLIMLLNLEAQLKSVKAVIHDLGDQVFYGEYLGIKT
jgi:hypothetical protein